tara:strand:- start:1885 stop:2070 length:186 start_codon:yes stop_codon:yes gene_type:complete
MEKEKTYIKLEQKDFFNAMNEYKEQILYNKPLYKIIVARIKRFIQNFRWKMIARKTTKGKA